MLVWYGRLLCTQGIGAATQGGLEPHRGVQSIDAIHTYLGQPDAILGRVPTFYCRLFGAVIIFSRRHFSVTNTQSAPDVLYPDTTFLSRSAAPSYGFSTITAADVSPVSFQQVCRVHPDCHPGAWLILVMGSSVAHLVHPQMEIPKGVASPHSTATLDLGGGAAQTNGDGNNIAEPGF